MQSVKAKKTALARISLKTALKSEARVEKSYKK